MRHFAVALALAGCQKSSEGPTVIDALDVPALFPATYRDTFVVERECRLSSDHDLQMIRIFVDPTAAPTYAARDAAFPIGTLIVKEQYDFADDNCTGPILQWTAAQHVKESDDVLTDHLGWVWQRINRRPHGVLSRRHLARCYGCHKDCTDPTMNGYRYTCSQPP